MRGHLSQEGELPGGLVVKNLPANAGNLRDVDSIPGLGRSPGGGHGNPLQYSHLENSLDREAWWATVHRVAKIRTWLKRPSTHPCRGREEWMETPGVLPWASGRGQAMNWDSSHYMRTSLCVGKALGLEKSRRGFGKLNWKCLLGVRMEMPRGRWMYISGNHGGALDWSINFGVICI